MNLNSPTGIYIHIPFCLSKCSYCNFYSIAKPKDSLLSDYITCLCNEITQTKTNYRLENRISTLYIGGGTPNILSLIEVNKLINHLEKTFNFKLGDLDESTIEINPGLSSFDYLKSLRNLGFNRVSIGIQSLNNNILSLMRRPHNKTEGLECLNNSFRAGFNNISCDLIFNYPTQTEEIVLSDLKQLLSFPIKHLSAYSLSVEPKTLLSKQIETKKLFLGNEDKERETYYKINEILDEKNFNHYEISNYALENFESKQNNLYWSLGSYYGFGPAASSFLSNIRIDRPANLKSYLKKEKIPDENIHILSESELKEEFMFLGLRKLNGIFDKDYLKIFESSFFKDFDLAINKCIQNGLLIKIEDGIKLTPMGIDFADRVALEFLY